MPTDWRPHPNTAERQALVEALAVDPDLDEWVKRHKALALRVAKTVTRLSPRSAPFEHGRVLASRLALARSVGAQATKLALQIGG